MSSRYSKTKDYFMKYRIKTLENKTKFFNYLRQRIIQRERRKIFNILLFWTPLIGGAYLIYNEIYSKIIERRAMESKIQKLYSQILIKEELKLELACSIVSPKNIDQLANLVALAHRYHFKVIVRMDPMSKKQKIRVVEQLNSKCIFLNIAAINNQKIDTINNTIYIQTGASCLQVNQYLKQQGYLPLFPIELDKEKVYDVIIGNLPLNEQELSKATISMELISAKGELFRSASQTNRYGEIPSLNPLFIGTGGVFALPTAITLKVTKADQSKPLEQNLRVEIRDVNERISFLRRLNAIDDKYVSVQLYNNFSTNQQSQLYLRCKERYSGNSNKLDVCSCLGSRENQPVTAIDRKEEEEVSFNLFFSVNSCIFEQFYLSFGCSLPFKFQNGLLKVYVADQNEQKFNEIINKITIMNGVLVWCRNKEVLMKIKPSLDSSQVGAQLMHKIVQVRQGLDRTGVLYSHSRYENYFAKGMFRKLTEFFW